MKLSWRPNTTDLDLVGYIVYRQVDGRTMALNDEPLAEARFIDRSPLDVPCLYAVTAVDSRGNESGWTWVTTRAAPIHPDLGAALTVRPQAPPKLATVLAMPQ